MSGAIRVAYAGVEELAATLRTTAQRLASAIEPVEAAARVASGSPAVDAELGRITAQAGGALAGVADALAADASTLDAAVAGYAEADRQAAAAAGGRP